MEAGSDKIIRSILRYQYKIDGQFYCVELSTIKHGNNKEHIIMRQNILIAATFSLCLLSCAEKRPQDFQDFLAMMRETESPDAASFGDTVVKDGDRIDTARYARFLPRDSDAIGFGAGCPWVKGSYMETGGKVVAFLSEVCWDYNDRYKKFLVENSVCKRFMVTYSGEGELIDYRELGLDSYSKTYAFNMEYDKPSGILTVESGYLANPALLDEYKDYVFKMTRRQYTVSREGKIRRKTLGGQYSDTVANKDAHVEQMDFKSLLASFSKWDRPYINDSVFGDYSADAAGLDVRRLFGLVPQLTNCDCLSKGMGRVGCGKYIDTGNAYVLFINYFCTRRRYSYDGCQDFIALEFGKDGRLRQTWTVYRHEYEMQGEDYTEECNPAILNDALRRKWLQISQSL